MKVKDIINNRKKILPVLLFLGELAAGFVFSGASMVGTSAFADISIAGASGLAGSSAIFMGSLLRGFAYASIGKNIVKLSAIVMIIIAKLLMDNKRSPMLSGIYTGVSVLLSGIAVSAVIGELVYKLAFYVFYSAAAGFTTYSLCRIIHDIENGAAVRLTASSGCYYAVVYTIYTASLCSAQLPLLNAGAVLGIAVTMLASFYYGSTGGVICGALTSCAAYLSSEDTGASLVLLPAAGLFSGFIRQRRIPLAAVIFMAMGFMLTVLTGTSDKVIYSLANYVMAAGIFIAAAPYYSDRHIRVSQSTGDLSEVMQARLVFLADSVAAVRGDTKRIADNLKKKYESPCSLKDDTEEVCGRCYRRYICRRQGSSTLKGA